MEYLFGTSPTSVSGYLGGGDSSCLSGGTDKLTESKHSSLASFERQIPRLLDARKMMPVEERMFDDPIINAMRYVSRKKEKTIFCL